MATEVGSESCPTAAELRDDRLAFEAAMERWYPATLRLARALTPDELTARQVVLDAWQRTIDSLSGLDADADIARLLLRTTVEAAAARLEVPPPEPAVPPDRFESESSRWAGWWRNKPEEVGTEHQAERLKRAFAALAPVPAAVITLRDLEGISAAKVEAILGFPAAAQRAILHAGRTAIWRAMAPGGQES